jgi:hypothetical protein
VWTTCTRLSFNGAKSEQQHSQVFIDQVNTVLWRHRGRGVDQFEIKFVFESKLARHLDSWIRFAMSSHTKNLAFDLAPSSNFIMHGDRYRFPFELVGTERVSCLERLQLCFVSFGPPPTHFVGFSNLKRLALYVLNTTSKDLESVLGSCCKLEWLSIVRCHLKDELKVTRPLPHLHYLRVMHCDITKIDFHAAKLSQPLFIKDHSYLLPSVTLRNLKRRKSGSTVVRLFRTLSPHFSTGFHMYKT